MKQGPAMTTISKTFANSRSLLLTAAVAAAVLAGLMVMGQGAVQARGADEQAETKAETPVEAAQPVKECKPVRVVYGGYGEQSCKAASEGR
jgi:hypothetical protein